jgi:hypothetical protein
VAFRAGREAGEVGEPDLTRGAQPPGHLDAVVRADDVSEERVGEVEKQRVLAHEWEPRPDVAELLGGAESALAARGLEEPARDRLGVGDEHELTVLCQKGAHGEPGHLLQRDLPAGDFDRPLATGRVPTRGGQHAHQGLRLGRAEEQADRGSFAQERVSAEERDLGHGRGGQCARIDDQLSREAAPQAVVEAAHGDEVAQIAAPLVEKVHEPQQVSRPAGAQVEALLRHAQRDRLDGLKGERGVRHCAQRDGFGQRQVRDAPGPVPAQECVALGRDAD